MGIVVTPDYTAMRELTTEYIKRSKPTPGSNAKQSEINAAGWNGVREGFAIALAAIATEKRVEVLAPLLKLVEAERQWTPGVSRYDLVKWLNELEKLWADGAFKEMSDEDYTGWLEDSFRIQVVNADGFADIAEQYRRKAVLAGLLDPQADDAAWIKEERENFAALVSPYDAALAKLEG